MTTCSHSIPLEQKCPHCLAEGLARESALSRASLHSRLDYRGDAVNGQVMTDPRNAIQPCYGP